LPKKAVFFDLGGTLFVMRRDRIFRRLLEGEGYPVSVDRVHEAYSEAESAWLRRYGYRRLSPDKSVESYRRLDAFAFRRVFPDAPKQEATRLSRLMKERWGELEGSFPPRLYPDATPTLRRLKRMGLTLGLISNAPPNTTDVIRRLGLDRFMGAVVVSGEVGVAKPNPEIFRIALAAAGVEPEESVHVGDVYEADVVGARKAGMDGILIDRGGSPAPRDCPVISTLTDVFPLLA
jgi:putative hydrolase of the HAD superfamily